MVGSLFSPVMRLAYPGGHTGRLPVLMYHRVLPEWDPLQPGVPHLRQMDAQFAALAQFFQVMTVEDAAEQLTQGRLPARALCITFDDGYRDNHDAVLPLLLKHGLKANFYIATAYLDGGRMFNDTVIEAIRRVPTGDLDLTDWGLPRMSITDVASRRDAITQITGVIKYFEVDKRQAFCDALASHADSPLPDDVMMRSEHVTALDRAGMSIGGHTVNHVILEKADDDQARDEIIQNRDVLHSLIGHAPKTFAYPNGKPIRDYAAKHARMVRDAGYVAAVSAAVGVGDSRTDVFQIPRFVLNDSSPVKVFLRTFRNASHLCKDYA